MGLYDDSGQLVRAERVELVLGQSAAISVNGRELGALPGQRVAVYGVVHCLGNVTARRQCATSVQPTLEVFDLDSGATTVMQSVVPTATKVRRLR